MQRVKVEVEPTRSALATAMLNSNTSGRERLWDTALKFLWPGLFITSADHLVGIHDVHVFNTELAMHYRAIFNCGYSRLFYERERIRYSVLVYISRNKSKTGPEWQFFSV